MKTKEEIQKQYEDKYDFYHDNPECAFDEMVYYRQMIEEAKWIVENQIADDSEAKKWMEKYDNIVQIEDSE